MKDFFCTKENCRLLFAGPVVVLVSWLVFFFLGHANGQWFGLVISAVVAFAFTAADFRIKLFFDIAEFSLMITAGAVTTIAIHVFSTL